MTLTPEEIKQYQDDFMVDSDPESFEQDGITYKIGDDVEIAYDAEDGYSYFGGDSGTIIGFSERPSGMWNPKAYWQASVVVEGMDPANVAIRDLG